MVTPDSLVQRAETYAHAAKLSLATVSFRILNDGKRLDLLKRGEATITYDRLSRADQALRELERLIAPDAHATADTS